MNRLIARNQALYGGLAAVLLLLSLSGCASTGASAPAGPSDEERVTTLLNDMLAALGAHDISAMSASYSDDFQSNQGTDKAGTVEFLENVKDQGFLDGMEIDSSGLTVMVDGDTAEAEGVEIKGAFGVLALSFKLEKRDGNWLVTYQAQE